MVASYIAVVFYTFLVIAIGISGARRTKSFSDFLIGGGSIGPWMTAFSYGTAYFSAVMFIGFAGKVGWGFGMSGLWIALGNSLVGVTLVWLLLAKRVRSVSAELKIHTMPEYLEARYNSPFLKVYSSVATFVFLVPYSAAVFIGLTYLLKITFAIPYEYMLVFMGVLTGIYLILGGYKSMASVDIYFGIMMILGVAVLVASSVAKAGSLEIIFSRLREIDPRLVAPVGPPGFWPLFSLVVLTSVGPFAMPQLIQKFYGVKDERSIRIGTVVSTGFALLATVGAYFTGALTRVFLTPQANPGAWKAAADGTRRLIPEALMPELLRTVIPGALSGVILLLVLAASMSTLAAMVLVSGSTIAKDLYHGFIKRDASDAALTRAIRIASAAFILISMGVAYLRPAIVVTIISISWGAIAAVMLGPFLWGLFSKRVNAFGASASAVVSLVICLALFIAWGAPKAPQAASLSMLSSLVLPPILSLGGRRRQ
ncbi:sodium:solute symporter [Candidatus Fermentibacteria bacterium]|nr:sodium:solute symporter [Candidatus Fermentibacteria bacterium]